MLRVSVIILSALLVLSGGTVAVGGTTPSADKSTPGAVVGSENATTTGATQLNATLSVNTTQITSNETIQFTLAATQDSVWLSNPKPYVIQRRDAGRWQTVYAPPAPMVIPPPIKPGESRSWEFSPQLLDEPRPGEYRVNFTIWDANFSESSTLSARFRIVSGAVLALQPTETQISTNETVALNVVVQNATDGVRAYDLHLNVSGISLAIPGEGLAVEVVSVGDRTGAASVETRIGPNNHSAAISATDVDAAGPTSTLARVTVVGMKRGEAAVTLRRTNVTDRNSSQYVIAAMDNASVTVRPDLPPIKPGLDPPTDPDSDGLYEDVNGDGTFTVIDVAVFLETFDSAVVENNATRFDYNGDGQITILDVATLLAET